MNFYKILPNFHNISINQYHHFSDPLIYPGVKVLSGYGPFLIVDVETLL